jgi:hypothetical protein
MAEEGTDLLGGFGRENVLELAGLLFDLALIRHSEALGEETLGETVTANHASGTLASSGSKFDDHAAVGRELAGRLERVVTGILDCSMGVGVWSVRDEVD